MAAEGRWLAAIDGFGIKRLAYYRDEKVFCIASRVDALGALSAMSIWQSIRGRSPMS